MADGSVLIDTKLDDSGLKKGINGIGGNFSKLSSIASKAFKGMTVAVGAVATAMTGLITAGAKYNATIEQYATSFEVMTGSAEKATEVVEKLKKIGAETPFEMTDLADTTQLLMNYGLTADDSISKMKMLGDISQGSADKMNRIAMAYGQMSSAGKVQLEDIKQMIEAGFNPLQEISQTTGESMASLYDRISKGTISVDEITASMERSTSVGGKYFQSMEKQSQTVNGQISTLKDNATQLIGSLSESFSTTLGGTILPFLNQMISSLHEAFQTGGIEAFVEKLGSSISEIVTKISEGLPHIIDMGVKIIQSLITGIQNNLPQIIESAIKVIQTLLESFLSMLPQILQMGITMLVELIKGIAQMIPDLIPMAINCIITLVETLIDNLDMIIDAGIELIIGLAEGLIEAIPRLIEKIPVIIEKLINAIVNNLPKIIQMGIELIIKLTQGLIKAIPSLIKAIPQIISALLNGLANATGQLINAGANLIKGIWQGMSNTINWIWNKISGFCSSIVSKIKGFFGIHSPSKLFKDEIGQYLGLGLGEGFQDSLSGVYKDMQKAIDYENAKLSSNLTSSQQISLTNEDNRQSRLESIDNNKEIQVNSTLNLDGKVVANAVNKVNAKQKLQYGIA